MDPNRAFDFKIICDPFVTREKVFFTLNWSEKNEYKSCVCSFDGEIVQKITSGGKERSPSLKGSELYYIQSKSGVDYLVKQPSGASPVEVFRFKKILKYSMKGDDVYALVEDKRIKSRLFITDRIKYGMDGRGLLVTRRKLVRVSGSGIKTIVEGEFDVHDFQVTASQIIFISSEGLDDTDLATQHIFTYDLENGELRRVTQGLGSALMVSTDGEGKIAYVGHREGATLSTPNTLIFPETGKKVEIGNDINYVFTDMFPSGQNRLLWDDGFYTIAMVGGNNYLFRYKDEVLKMTKEGVSILDFNVSSGSIAYVYSSFKKPSVLSFNGREYDPNQDFEGTQAERDKVGAIDYWTMISDRGNPTILYVHGGPHDAYGPVYFCEHDFMAKNGFNVIFANPTGSAGYGRDFEEGCIGNWGPGPLRDLISVLDHAKSKYNLKENFQISGLSYGGYMAAYAITQTNRFLSAVSEDPVTNLFTMCGTSDIGFWYLPKEFAIDDPWKPENVVKLIEMSPIFRAKNVSTPTLFVHGEEDLRCPIEQSEQMYRALRMNNVESKLVRIKGESHLLSIEGAPSVKKDRLRLKLKWFRDHSKKTFP